MQQRSLSEPARSKPKDDHDCPFPVDGWQLASVCVLACPLRLCHRQQTVSSPGQTACSDSGGNLAFAASGLPEGLSISPSSCLISDTIVVGAAQQGPFTVTITATYNGDSNFNSSTSDSLDQVVGLASSTTLASSSSNPADYGDTVTFTATVSAVSPGSGTPTGSVTFYDGATSLGSNSLDGSGVATLSTSALTGGSHTISAVYGGDSNFLTSTSSNLDQVIQYTLTATAGSLSPYAGVNTGSVTMATASDSDPYLTASDLTATISWGDGTSSIATAANGGIVASGSNFNGSHTYAPIGSFPVSVTINDTANSLTTSVSLSAAVANPIALTNPGSSSNNEGDFVSEGISASTAGTIPLTWSASNLPVGLSIDPSIGVISGTVALGDSASSPNTVNLLVSAGAYSAATSFTWTISNPITLTNPGNQSTAENGTVSLSLSATDTAGTPVYAASGLPAGLSIDPSTGLISGTVALGDAASGPYSVMVTAEDGTYSSNQSFTWTVTTPVTLTAPLTQTNYEGDTVSLSLSASDTSGTLAFAASGLPEGLSLSPSSGVISGTIAAGSAQQGPFYVTITAGDGTYGASQVFTWNVNNPITLNLPSDQSNNEGDTVSLATGATDVSLGANTLFYGASGLPGGLSIDSSTGAITGTVSVGDAAVGGYNVILMASDGTYSDQEGFAWNIGNALTLNLPNDQSNNPGDSVSLALTASDAHSGTTLTWSANQLPPGLSIGSSSGVISGTPSIGGDFTPTIGVSDGTISTAVSFDWLINSSITITDPGSQSFNAGDAVSLQLQATDGSPGTLTYSISGLPAGLSLGSSSGLISGTLASTLTLGSYPSTLSVSDGSNTAQLLIDWIVYPQSSVTLTNPGTQTGSEGSALSLTLSATDSSGTPVFTASGLPSGLTLNPSSGVISGTPSAGDSVLGPYSVQVTASDGTYSDSQGFTWNISSPITLGLPSTQNNSEGDSVSLSLSASWSGTTSLVFSTQGLPNGLAVNPSTGLISGTVAPGDAAFGPYYVTVEASAPGAVAAQSFTWNVSSPISLTLPANQTSAEGASVSLTLSASDSLGTPVYSALGLPPGLQIDPSSGAISGTVALGAAASGPYSVTVLAEDGTYSTSQSFTWTVTTPITLALPADQTNNEGDTVTLSLSATDSGTVFYSALGLPDGLNINPTSGVISGTVSVGDAVAGPYYVTVLAEDGTYNTSQVFTWNINSPVALNIPDDQYNNAGDSVALSLSASNSTSYTPSYSVSGLPAGLSLSSGVISGTLTQGGFWQPTVTVSAGAYSDTESFAWSVASAITLTDPGDQFNNSGDTVSLQLQASDSAPGTLTYSASNLPAGLTLGSSSGLISGTITAATNTSVATTLSITDGTNTLVDFLTWSIGPLSLTSPGNQTNNAGDAVALDLSGFDASGAALLYSASGLPSGLNLNAYTGAVYGTIASSAVSGSPYTVTLQASDGSASASLTFTWTVRAAGTLTLANPGGQANNEGDSVSVALSSTYSGGGTVYYAAYGLPSGLKISPSSGAITGTVALGDAASGPYTVTVVANDGSHSSSQNFAWSISNPITLTLPDDQTNNEGDTVSLGLSGSDASGTLSYAAQDLPPGLAINPSSGAITGTVAVESGRQRSLQRHDPCDGWDLLQQ